MPPHAPESSPSFAAAADKNAIASDADKVALASSPPSQGWQRDMQLVGVIFLASSALLGVTLHSLVVSALTDAEWAALRLPTSLEAAQQLGETLQSFSECQPAAPFGVTLSFLSRRDHPTAGPRNTWARPCSNGF